MAAVVIKDLNRFPTERSYTYTDLELDLIIDYTKNNSLYNINEQKDVRADYDINAIKNSLFNIFTTIPGQKILNPIFGLNLYYFLFTGISEINGRMLGDTILKGINKYEPRVTVNYINVITDIENQQYIIDMIISVPSLNISMLSINGTLAESGFYFN
jgi:phage baseplate assembly protein W